MSSRIFNRLLKTGVSIEELRAFAKSPTHMARCAAMVKNQETQPDCTLEWLLYGMPYAATPKTQNGDLFNRLEITVTDVRLGEDFIQSWQRPAKQKIVSVAQIPSWGNNRDFLRAAAEMSGDTYLSTDESRWAFLEQCLSLKQADRFAGYMIDSFKNFGSFRQQGDPPESLLEFRMHQPVFVFVKLDFNWHPGHGKKSVQSQAAVMEMRVVSRRELVISLRNPSSSECWGPGTMFVGANIQEAAEL